MTLRYVTSILFSLSMYYPSREERGSGTQSPSYFYSRTSHRSRFYQRGVNPIGESGYGTVLDLENPQGLG